MPVIFLSIVYKSILCCKYSKTILYRTKNSMNAALLSPLPSCLFSGERSYQYYCLNNHRLYMILTIALYHLGGDFEKGPISFTHLF